MGSIPAAGTNHKSIGKLVYQRLEKCLCCKNDKLFTVLDLNTQPPANSYHALDVTIDEYELKLMGCDNCWHTQLSIAVDPSELFKHYLYVSGGGKTIRDYFDSFADRYSNKLSAGRCLDIACNDGTQLNSLKRHGWETWGIDPAENLISIAADNGHNVVCDFWTTDVAKTMPMFDLIIAQNVFAHTAHVDEFLQACKLVMNDNTLLVIQTSQSNMLDNNEFDTIYHEHISFFSISSMLAVANRNGLSVNHVYKNPIHGGSYIFELGTVCNPSGSIQSLLHSEQHRYSRDFLKTYSANAMACLANLKTFVDACIANNEKVVGYGAAAKGMTVLNAGKINLSYIVDDTLIKQGLYTPGMNIPIVANTALLEDTENLVIIPLAWNFYSEIRDKVKAIRPYNTDTFVRYFPSFELDRRPPNTFYKQELIARLQFLATQFEDAHRPTKTIHDAIDYIANN